MKREINRFVKYLQDRSLTVAFVESMTCGMMSEKLSAYKGTADVFMGAVICYNPKVKTQLLKVPSNLIERHTCESMEVTEVLAGNLSRLITADIHAAVTGLAATGGSETKNKPVGTVFFCFRYKGRFFKRKKRYYGTPMEIKKKACLEMFSFILSHVK